MLPRTRCVLNFRAENQLPLLFSASLDHFFRGRGELLGVTESTKKQGSGNRPRQLGNDEAGSVSRMNSGKSIRGSAGQRNRGIGKRSGSREPIRRGDISSNRKGDCRAACESIPK
jgi:hypothetical protein